MKWSVDLIRKQLENRENNLVLLSEEYKNVKSKLLFKCLKCNNQFFKTWDNMKNSNQFCPFCGAKSRANQRRMTLEKAKDYIKHHYPCVKVLSSHLNDSKTKLKCYCLKCHNIFYQHINGFKNGKGCKYCGIKRRSGINHYRYNPNLTSEEREKTRNALYGKYIDKWRKDVLKKYHFQCVVCHSHKNLIAHHLNSFSSFPEERFDENNGVVLCETHHKEFHRLYGYKENTKEQFDDYIYGLRF